MFKRAHPRAHPYQGCARDMSGRDRDETETLSSPAETRPRPDVYSSKQVNVGLTTVGTVTACPLVSWCIVDFCLFNSSDYVQTVFMPLQSVGTGR